MVHLSGNDIRELVISYREKETLNEKQLGEKRHMAECDSCYERFCVEYALQKSLFQAGLMNSTFMKEIVNQSQNLEEKVLLTITTAIDTLELSIRNMAERLESIWSFYQAPHLAEIRGGLAGTDEVVYECEGAEYSFIKNNGKNILICLDEKDYNGRNLKIKIVRGGREEYIEFKYNEDEESLEAIIPLAKVSDARIEIVEERHEN